MVQIRLYQLRKEHNLSQADMAKVIGKSEVSYRERELDRRAFTLPEMYKIANVFNKELGEIFIDTTSRNVKEGG